MTRPTVKPDRILRRPSRWWWLAGAVLLCGVAAGVAWEVLGGPKTRLPELMLRSEDPSRRKWGAWETTSDQGFAYIADRLAEGSEAVADVREAFVYTLGQHEQARYFDLVADLALADPSGYVRQAAWLAAARIDPHRFTAWVAAASPGAAPWDELGRANGCLEAGDVSGVPVLFRWAREGDTDQQRVAFRALYTRLMPLLVAAGRWPADVVLGEIEPWPAALLDEVERRCATLDLQSIADDTRPHLAAAQLVTRNTRRVTSAREWIATVLWWF